SLKAIAERVAGRFGAKLVTADVPTYADQPTWQTRVLNALTARTRAVILEQVTAVTGELVPVQSLTRSLGGRGLKVIVDGSQATGMIGDAVSRLGADV